MPGWSQWLRAVQEDPFFRRPLWLQTRCVGQILWAYNEEHVNELSAYVGATLREHGASPKRAMLHPAATVDDEVRQPL